MKRLTIDCAGDCLDLSQPRVMGILNVTPDSFSDGGRHVTIDAAVARGRRMVEEGASIIDIGGESTRPGADPVSVDEELKRVVPVIERLTKEISVPVSVDTRKAKVMREAVAAGAGMINDVAALREEGALETAAELGVPVCLMHMQGTPDTMQKAPVYTDVVKTVAGFLSGRVEACLAAGIPRHNLLVDPGFGFGKRLAHNIALLKHLDDIVSLGLPVLVGMSRKSMIGQLLDRPLDERVFGSVAAAVVAVMKGAIVVRTHDVGPTLDALKVAAAVLE